MQFSTVFVAPGSSFVETLLEILLGPNSIIVNKWLQHRMLVIQQRNTMVVTTFKTIVPYIMLLKILNKLLE